MRMRYFQDVTLKEDQAAVESDDYQNEEFE